MDGLIEGRVVHYVLEDGPYKGEHRPAVIVRVWPTELDYGCNLQVLTDGSNDGPQYAGGMVWKTSVPYSEEPKPRTWHWVERA